MYLLMKNNYCPTGEWESQPVAVSANKETLKAMTTEVTEWRPWGTEGSLISNDVFPEFGGPEWYTIQSVAEV